MSLIASNSEKTVRAVTEKAFSAYTGNDGSVEKVKEAILALTEVKGVGPATASLILSVYDPVSVPFFADELFLYTTARGMFASQAPGQKYKIKYNLKEYEEMLLQVQMIRERITTQANGVAGVSALDLEMTAYVLAHPPQLGQDRDGDKPTEEGQDKATATTAAVSNDKHDVTNNTTTHYGEEPPAKRRRTSERPT